MSSTGSSPTAEQRAQAIVEGVIARRRRGEVISDEQVLHEYPELLGPLEKLLRRASLLNAIRGQSSPANSPLPIDSLLNRLEEDSVSVDEQRVERRPDPEPPAPLITTQRAESPSSAQRARRLATSDDSDQEPDRLLIDERATIDHAPFSSPTPLVMESDQAEVPTPGADHPGGGPDADSDNSATTIQFSQASQADSTARYRPPTRPPMAVLHIFDDGQATYEQVRIRHDNTTIGRETGDVVVPHDALMSAEHALIERESIAGEWRWTLRDLNSTNGVYVKVRRVRLKDGERLLIANRTVFFSQGRNGQPSTLIELRPEGEGERMTLDSHGAVDHWIGRDRSICCDFLSSEPSLDNRFARMLRRKDGRWTMWSDPSVNGLWVAVDRVRLVSGGMFQLGEQRFAFHLP